MTAVHTDGSSLLASYVTWSKGKCKFSWKAHHDGSPQRWVIAARRLLGRIVEGRCPAQLPGAEEAGVEGEDHSFPSQLLRPQSCRTVGPLRCALYQGPDAPDVTVLH